MNLVLPAAAPLGAADARWAPLGRACTLSRASPRSLTAAPRIPVQAPSRLSLSSLHGSRSAHCGGYPPTDRLASLARRRASTSGARRAGPEQIAKRRATRAARGLLFIFLVLHRTA